MIKVIFILNGKEKVVHGNEGETILEIAQKNNIPLDGACGGNLACATCHIIVDDEFYNKLETASEEEEDILDLAFGVKKCSRLGCQIKLTEELDGIKIIVPN